MAFYLALFATPRCAVVFGFKTCAVNLWWFMWWFGNVQIRHLITYWGAQLVHAQRGWGLSSCSAGAFQRRQAERCCLHQAAGGLDTPVTPAWLTGVCPTGGCPLQGTGGCMLLPLSRAVRAGGGMVHGYHLGAW